MCFIVKIVVDDPTSTRYPCKGMGLSHLSERLT